MGEPTQDIGEYLGALGPLYGVMPAAGVNWQNAPENARLSLMMQILGVDPKTAANTLASMAFATNEKKATPGPYVTQLSPDLEKIFDAWATGNDLGNPSDYFPDYDLRGYWNAMRHNDPSAAYRLVPSPGGGVHVVFPPAYETPYNLDFGPQSIYWKKQ